MSDVFFVQENNCSEEMYLRVLRYHHRQLGPNQNNMGTIFFMKVMRESRENWSRTFKEAYMKFQLEKG